MARSSSTRASKDNAEKQSSVRPRDVAHASNLPTARVDLLALQRSVGNRAVGQLLQASLSNKSTQTNRAAESSEQPSVSDEQKAPSPAELLTRAHADPGSPLDESFRTEMEQHLGVSLSNVRLHEGASSEAAAESLGARAYTLGSNIHIGSEARRLSRPERNKLLAHETVHTVQQGGRPVAPQSKLQVSHPGDGAEVEAERIAESVMSGTAGRAPSPALALRNELRATPVAPQTVSRVAAPLIQRDLKGDHPIKQGKFTLNLKTESHPGAKNGMSGTIKFKANNKAPDSTNIKLLQVVRDEDLTTGKDYVWTGGEADRNKMMTVGNKWGVESGYFVDHSAADPKATPRTKKTDAPVSPYYRDYWPNKKNSQDGSKKGKTIKEASLWDYPGSSGNRRFSFETVAKATDTGHVYGTVMWGFTISDASKGKVEKERAVGRNVTLLTTDKAIEKFNEFYRNPGAKTAPK